MCCGCTLRRPAQHRASTSSAARLVRRSRFSPPPLRSWKHRKVCQAYRRRSKLGLYEVTSRLVLLCQQLNIWWSMENPSASICWVTDPMCRVAAAVPNMHTVVFDHCMYGGDRPKRTAVWRNARCIKDLKVLCVPPLQHRHLPWRRVNGRWATQDEAKYPVRLCAFWASSPFSEPCGPARGQVPCVNRRQQPGSFRLGCA